MLMVNKQFSAVSKRWEPFCECVKVEFKESIFSWPAMNCSTCRATINLSSNWKRTLFSSVACYCVWQCFSYIHVNQSVV